MTSSTTMQAVYAEKTLLGCALCDSSALYQILPVLRAEDFSLDSHRRIYHAIREQQTTEEMLMTSLCVITWAVNRSLSQSAGPLTYLLLATM